MTNLYLDISPYVDEYAQNYYKLINEYSVLQTVFIITSNSGNVEAAIRFFEFMYSKEGILLTNFGIEGDTYEIIDGKPAIQIKY